MIVGSINVRWWMTVKQLNITWPLRERNEVRSARWVGQAGCWPRLKRAVSMPWLPWPKHKRHNSTSECREQSCNSSSSRSAGEWRGLWFHIERCGSSNLSSKRNAVHCSDVKSQDRCLKSFALWKLVFTAWLACLYWKSPKRLTPEEDAELWRNEAKEFSLFYLQNWDFKFKNCKSSKAKFWVLHSFTDFSKFFPELFRKELSSELSSFVALPPLLWIYLHLSLSTVCRSFSKKISRIIRLRLP